MASVAGTTTSAPRSATPSTPPPARQSPLAFARCMRSHGEPGFPDPGPGGGFVFPAGSGVDPSSSAFEAAQAACRKLMPLGGLAPGSTTHPTTRWLAHMLKVARCMRGQGIAGFPDPTTRVPPLAPGVRLISDIEGAVFVFTDSIDPQSPLFTRAANACGYPLHNR